MVTFGEFVQHVLTAGLTMAASIVVLVVFATRYNDAHGFLRRALYALPICMGVVALLSLTAGITETRCTRDPQEFCRYNDNVPFMAMVVVIFVGVVLIRALLVWFYRPVRSTDGFFESPPPSHTKRREPRAQG